MKYKVGDKVRVRKDLVVGEQYGGETVADDMVDMRGMVVTIEEVDGSGYGIKEGLDDYNWTDEMFEPVEEELTVEEVIKLHGEMCNKKACSDCKLSSMNNGMGINCRELEKKHPDKVVEFLKQYKKDNEIETEYIWYVQIVEADTHILKHEEPLKGVPEDRTIAEVLKKWCSEHEGKYYAISERRCIVKE